VSEKRLASSHLSPGGRFYLPRFAQSSPVRTSVALLVTRAKQCKFRSGQHVRLTMETLRVDSTTLSSLGVNSFALCHQLVLYIPGLSGEAPFGVRILCISCEMTIKKMMLNSAGPGLERAPTSAQVWNAYRTNGRLDRWFGVDRWFSTVLYVYHTCTLVGARWTV
jgi:hypothetical protein